MSDESEIIQSVYAVAVEPERYDDLVTTWVAKLSAALFAYQDNPQDSESAALNDHVARATRVISLLAASQVDDAPKEALTAARAQPEAQPAMRVDHSGEFISCNASATQAYGVQAGDKIADLPFDEVAQRTIHALVAKLIREQGVLAPSKQAGAEQARSTTAGLVHAVHKDTGQTLYLSLVMDEFSELHLISTDIVWPERLDQLMSDSFGLTKAERAVGKGLVEGATMQDIAASRSSSIATVRAQARSLFEKTATNSQREFMRMAIGLSALYPDTGVSAPSDDPQSTISPVLPLAEDWQMLRLRDGRGLPYALLGDPDGRPCLFIHDAIFGPALPRELVEEAAQAGLKLIVPARQGWRGAPDYPEGSNAFLQFARDCRELMRSLKLNGVLLVGRVLGATYAFEILREDPSRYIGIMGITPALPIGEREDINRMAPHHRLLTVSIGANATLLNFVTRAALAIYDRYGGERLLRMIYRSSKADLELINDPATFAAMSAGLTLSGGGSNHPFFKDLKDRPSEHWHPGMELGVPFHALLGELDPSARQRRAERMIERGVNLTYTLLPDAGELFVYSQAPAIIEAISGMFDSVVDKPSGVAIPARD